MTQIYVHGREMESSLILVKLHLTIYQYGRIYFPPV